MKISLIFPREVNNTKNINYYYQFNLGLGYIAAILKNNKYQVDCYNYNHCPGSVESITKEILDKNKYDFILIGGTHRQFWQIKKIIATIKKHLSGPKIILGGLILAADAGCLFQATQADYGVIGEGETTVIDLLDCLQNNKNINAVDGIVYRNARQEAIRTKPRLQTGSLDDLPYPDLSGFDFENYLNHQNVNMGYVNNAFNYPRPYPILGSRGCFYRCTFCYHYCQYRERSVGSIIEELSINIIKYKINIINFYDECIGLNKNRLSELCAGLNKLKERIPWEIKVVLNLTVKNLDEEILSLLKKTGVFIISYGFESFDPGVLKSMNKPITPEEIEYAFCKTLENKIGVQANFIFGDISETEATARTTLKWWRIRANGQIQLYFIQAFPGSAIYEHNVKNGRIKKEISFLKEIFEPNFINLTAAMSNRQISRLHKEIMRANYKHRKFPKILSLKKTKRNTYTLELNCPHCNQSEVFENCHLQSRLFFGFYLTCRKCFYRFYVASGLKVIGHKLFPYLEPLFNGYFKLKKFYMHLAPVQ